MPFAQGFATGRAAGPNPFSAAISKLNQIEAEKRAVDNKIAQQASGLRKTFIELGKKHEFDKEIVRFKEEEKRKTQSQGMDQFLEALGGGQRGDQENFPPGTTASVPGPGGSKINLPLNRKFTGEEQRVIAGSQNIADSVDKALGFVNQGKVDNLISQVLVDSGNPLFVSGDLEALMSEINQLKSIIPFAKGGKQLTPFEAKQLFRLVDTKGKSKETIAKDLTRFKDEFNRLSTLAIGGSEGLKQQSSTSQGKTASGIGYTIE